MTSNIGYGKIEEITLFTYSLNYKTDTDKDIMCQLCIKSFIIPIPGAEVYSFQECYPFYYEIKKPCSNTCTLGGEWKCLDAKTAGKCEVQPNSSRTRAGFPATPQ